MAIVEVPLEFQTAQGAGAQFRQRRRIKKGSAVGGAEHVDILGGTTVWRLEESFIDRLQVGVVSPDERREPPLALLFAMRDAAKQQEQDQTPSCAAATHASASLQTSADDNKRTAAAGRSMPSRSAPPYRLPRSRPVRNAAEIATRT